MDLAAFEHRLTELETRLAFQEHALAQMSDALAASRAETARSEVAYFFPACEVDERHQARPVGSETDRLAARNGDLEKRLEEREPKAVELFESMEEVKKEAAEFMKIRAVWQFFEGVRN